MMKKLLLMITSLIAVERAAAQVQISSPPIVVVDTLHYYFNKYYFKTGQTTYSNYPYYKSAASTVTNVTHCGSRFENMDTLIITGLEAFAAKHAISANLQIPVHLYLCNIGGNGKPVLPPIDSIITAVGGSSQINPVIIGGNFTTPHKVNGDFAVLFRNYSQVAGDTVHLLRTDGATYNNMAALPRQRCSDTDYGFVRFNGQFYSTRDFTLHYGFGQGTDYEFMVAPRVVYQVVAGHIIPQAIGDANAGLTDTLCTRTPFTYTNISSYQFTNRFYNLNEFYRKWNLYSSFATGPICCGGFSADSAITWNFEYEENALPPRDPRTFLPYMHQGINHGAITSTTDQKGCFDANVFRARLRPMSAFGRQPQLAINLTFSLCMKYCNDDGDGIVGNGDLPNLKLFPNPMENGKTKITGLEGKNTIQVYDLIGQLVSTMVSDEPTVTVDLSNQPKGTYIVKVSDTANRSRAVRLVNPE
jgi:hypothetical protein